MIKINSIIAIFFSIFGFICGLICGFIKKECPEKICSSKEIVYVEKEREPIDLDEVCINLYKEIMEQNVDKIIEDTIKKERENCDQEIFTVWKKGKIEGFNRCYYE